MKARLKRRARRTHISNDEHETLSRIAEQLDRLQAPVNPDVLLSINTRLSRIESRLDGISDDVSRRGAVAGAMAGAFTGGIITVAIMFIRAKLEL
ncbi:hypothetical protein [Trabulsiella odontotermitis]|uniref:hypothetical protein n=1 Tax=Trabulsiella odontotermitis TaxID=379893 RepID=UPI000676631D|nr:hypothetical protein [Trabulsiella odontotermitis]KNC89912.1 hypothetical protein GM30_06090 [Trabulsiella odontotermitis]